MAYGSLSRFWKRLCEVNEAPRHWWYPREHCREFSSDADRRQQHDETSRTISHVMLYIGAFSFFCLLNAGIPDLSLLSGNGKVKIPFVDIEFAFFDFLLIGPVVLIALTGYLHIFVGYQRTLGAGGEIPKLPYLFNIESREAQSLSIFLFYWLVPIVLLIFSYRASPLPGGRWLFIMSVTFTIILEWIQIRRYPFDQRRNLYYRFLWSLESLLIMVIVLQALNPFLLFPFFPRQVYLPDGAKLEAPNLSSYTLIGANLSAVNLDDASLTSANLRGADLDRAMLKRANLVEANLQDATLTDADLEDANLSAAKLQGATLSSANLQGAGIVDAWLQKAKLVDANLQGATLVNAILQEADLLRANLLRANLQKADLRRANLQNACLMGANLSGAKNLTVEQLSNVSTLFTAILDGPDMQQIEKKYPNLLKEPGSDKWGECGPLD